MAYEFSDVFVHAADFRSIIDPIHPNTGRGVYSGETLDQIRQRYPDAVRMSFSEWQAGAVALQNRPITWYRVTRDQYRDMYEVLPPAANRPIGFLVGEPADHSRATGQPRYQAYIRRAGQYFAASRPMTCAEFEAIE